MGDRVQIRMIDPEKRGRGRGHKKKTGLGIGGALLDNQKGGGAKRAEGEKGAF